MKILFLLISTIYIFLNTAHAQTINECKTDIYFGNGVWNSPEQAEASRIRYEKYIIKKEIINNDPKLQAKYGKVKLAYNWGQGTMLDVLETYYQLKAAGQVQDYQFFAVIYALTKGNLPLTLSAVATKGLMEPLTRNWEEGNVHEMWEKYYNESFKLGHRVLLVSHSQGNLFANRIHNIIAPTQYQNYFANLQVASPAFSIKAQKGDYVTLSTDSDSYDIVVNFIPGSMSPNVSGGSGHAFISAYLSQADPFNDIVTKTKQLLLALDLEDTQWQTDQEFDRGTKDYMITVKHRFDTSVIMDEQVHPFAPSKKLYYVNEGNTLGYVKASCGGKQILSTWVGQKDNEFYLINNQEKEKIIYESCTVDAYDGPIKPYSHLIVRSIVGSVFYGGSFKIHISSFNIGGGRRSDYVYHHPWEDYAGIESILLAYADQHLAKQINLWHLFNPEWEYGNITTTPYCQYYEYKHIVITDIYRISDTPSVYYHIDYTIQDGLIVDLR